MSASYLRRGLIGAALCILLAIAYQYQYKGTTVENNDLDLLRTAARTAAKMPRAPVIALSHGGGPMPLMNDPNHKDITASLRNRVPRLLGLNTPSAPRAIVLVTAHWSTGNPTITSSSSPSLLYDYYGFPPETYKLKYPAPGSPSVADEVKRAMEAQGLRPSLDPKREWDHGVFVPLLLVNPAADIPVVQVSVLGSEDPRQHFAMGKALESLRDDGVAIVGSGFASFHNLGLMRQLMGGRGAAFTAFKQRSDAWNDRLGEAVNKADAAERAEDLAGWRAFPAADEMHPRGGGEHFMPLLVCAGAAGNETAGAYKDDFLGVDIWTYYWGAATKAE
ncbi:uncharacterized protein DNG_05607 [Cephalotrichum gorgonifer]|uniref:Extradiol ring-cleavage dioxygenase class III enzyme subunit B domain-containing protein n=1 Tax=Cephalotrichum gorgonifer TaxID=2041049 RepID=A0AAE8MZZ6_9PEZI|nr:uncharacterized protein DNG_05607 [Cephalotrichum gorgonifer]